MSETIDNLKSISSGENPPVPFISPLDGVNSWQFIRESSKGDGGYADSSYVIRKPLTPQDSYERLQVEAYPTNYFKKVIKHQTDPVFKKGSEHTFTAGTNSDLLEAFLENVNRRGVSMKAFMAQAGFKTKLQSMTGILVDGATTEQLEESGNLQLQIEKRIYPTASIINPDRFIDDWTILSDFDDLERVAYWQSVGKEKFVIEWTPETRKEYTQEEWDKGVDEKTGVRKGTATETNNKIGEVPIVRYYGVEVDFGEFIPFPENLGLAKLQMRIFNCDSDVTYMEWGQSHSTLIAPQGMLSKLATGIGVALGFLKEDGEPKYISPDGTQFTNLGAYRQDLVKDMHVQANLSHMHMGEGSNALSGEAKKQDFQVTSLSMTQFAETSKRVEDEIVRLFGKWVGSDFKYNATYSKEFFEIGTLATIEEGNEFLLSMPSPTAVKEIKLKMSRAALGNDNPALEDIESELEKERISTINQPIEPEPVPPEE